MNQQRSCKIKTYKASYQHNYSTTQSQRYRNTKSRRGSPEKDRALWSHNHPCSTLVGLCILGYFGVMVTVKGLGSNVKISALANVSPGHLRAPTLKGITWSVFTNSVSEFRKRSGLKTLGSVHVSGSWWTSHRFGTTMLSLGMVNLPTLTSLLVQCWTPSGTMLAFRWTSLMKAIV